MNGSGSVPPQEQSISARLRKMGGCSFGKGSTYAKLLKVAPSKNSVKKATQTEKGEERASGAS
ncbi:hypothetical protein FOFC_17468 [Fusarium oxysporum]|nr:hypothetical protein FOFC_17468 [Fusarium oxysporum]